MDGPVADRFVYPGTKYKYSPPMEQASMMPCCCRMGFACLATLFCLCISMHATAAEYSGSEKDLALIASIKGNGDKFVSDRSILWVEKGYLEPQKANVLQRKIDRGIMVIEDFIGIKFDRGAYKKARIEYFLYSGQEPSHTITNYQPRKYMHPVVFLGFAAEGKSPYLHETVHIIAWDWHTPWIEEGLAVFLNDTLNGDPAFPNYGKDIDREAKSMLGYKSALRLVGNQGIPAFPNWEERRAFYILAGSFTKYLHTELGMDKLMRIYQAKDTNKAVHEITGHKLDMLTKEWLENL